MDDFKPRVWEVIRDGRLSGYPWCCIFFFILRKWLLLKKLYRKILPNNKNLQHILCPFHYLYHLAVPPRYHYCFKCNWLQYRNVKCMICQNCEHSFHFIGSLYICKVCGFVKSPTYVEWHNGERISHYDRPLLRKIK